MTAIAEAVELASAASASSEALPGAVLGALAALRPHRPRAVASALAVLPRFLPSWDPYPSGREVEERASRRLAGGFPVLFEFAFATGPLRITGEVNAPPRRALGRAADEIGSLGDRELDPVLIADLEQLQEGADLHWGAWIASRFGDDGTCRFKLYGEVPESRQMDAHPVYGHFLGDEALLPGLPAPRLRMIGLEADSGGVELYFRARGLEAGHLGRLLGRIGFADRQGELLEALRGFRKPSHRLLPEAPVGFSFAFHEDGRPRAFALFLFARHVLGRDASVRRGILRELDFRGLPAEDYRRVSAPLAGASRDLQDGAGISFPFHHGMVGFGIPAHGPLVLSTDLRPPEISKVAGR